MMPLGNSKFELFYIKFIQEKKLEFHTKIHFVSADKIQYRQLLFDFLVYQKKREGGFRFGPKVLHSET